MKDYTREIVKLCLQIDIAAQQTYQDLSVLFPDPELQAFWKTMAAEEEGHVAFWKQILALPENLIALPHIFEDPEAVVGDLRALIPKVEQLRLHCSSTDQVEDAFLLAYRLEFYMLHPAFETLYSLLRTLVDTPCQEDDYKDHIDQFIDGLRKYGELTPALELLGETLCRLLHENKKLFERATRDSLTGCLNRQAFFEISTHLGFLTQRNRQTAATMMIDLDHFKLVNDKWGHRVGDEVLRATGDCIRMQLRASDVVGRYGGEEFVVFMPDINQDTVVEVANRIRLAFAGLITEEAATTLSIGVSLRQIEGDVGQVLAEMVDLADQNLYRAKQEGRNRVVC